MAPRPGRIHKEYKLPFANMGLKEDLREIKKNKDKFNGKKVGLIISGGNVDLDHLPW